MHTEVDAKNPDQTRVCVVVMRSIIRNDVACASPGSEDDSIPNGQDIFGELPPPELSLQVAGKFPRNTPVKIYVGTRPLTFGKLTYTDFQPCRKRSMEVCVSSISTSDRNPSPPCTPTCHRTKHSNRHSRIIVYSRRV